MEATLLPAVTQATLTPAAAQAIDTTPRDLIEQWLARVAPGTRRKYSQALAGFGTWALGDRADPESAFRFLTAQNVGSAHALVERWRDSLVETGLAPGSVNGLLTGLGSLVGLARRLGLCSWKLERVGLPPEKREDRSGPSRAEVLQLVEYVQAEAAAGSVSAIRNVAIIRILHGAALRRNEVVTLDLDHVQLDHGDGPSLMVLRKGKRERVRVGIGPKAAQALQDWLSERGGEPGPVFIRLNRGSSPGSLHRLLGESIRRMLRNRAKAAGIEHACRPHGLRHSSATDVARTGSIDDLMAFGGWSSPSSAMHYLDRQGEKQRAMAVSVEV